MLSSFQLLEWGCKGGSHGNRVNVEVQAAFTLLFSYDTSCKESRSTFNFFIFHVFTLNREHSSQLFRYVLLTKVGEPVEQTKNTHKGCSL